MPRHLETGWYRAGRSGDTIDGREINDLDISDMAETYDAELYTALIWPEHYRYANLGKVTQVRSEKNSEGGLDLFVKFAPNDYYLHYNDAGQKLFLSMELKPNFRNTGKTYLSGLGATDDPASVATSEVRFSRIGDKEKNVLISTPVEATATQFDNDQQNEPAPGWFNSFANKLFNMDNDDMSKQAIAALQTQLTELATKFSAAFPEEKPTEAKPAGEGEDDKFTALETAVADLTAKFAALEAKQAGNDKTTGAESQKLYAELKTAFENLETQFKAALEEQPGTSVDEDTGGEDNSKYI